MLKKDFYMRYMTFLLQLRFLKKSRRERCNIATKTNYFLNRAVKCEPKSSSDSMISSP